MRTTDTSTVLNTGSMLKELEVQVHPSQKINCKCELDYSNHFTVYEGCLGNSQVIMKNRGIYGFCTYIKSCCIL